MRPPILGLVVVAAALASCGGTTTARGHQAARTPGVSSPTQVPMRLSWRSGESFSASVDQEVHTATATSVPGALATPVDLAMSSRLRLTVRSVQDGIATLDVAVADWGWRQSGAYHRAGDMPAPWSLQVGLDGSIVSGRLWAMAQAPPLPGVDFLSAGLPPTGWSPDGGWTGSWLRTLEDGTPLIYAVRESRLQSSAGRAAVQSTVRCQLTRRIYTPDAQPDLVQGTINAVIKSDFDTGTGVLLDTSYTTSFTVVETESRGAVRTLGSVATVIRLST